MCQVHGHVRNISRFGAHSLKEIVNGLISIAFRTNRNQLNKYKYRLSDRNRRVFLFIPEYFRIIVFGYVNRLHQLPNVYNMYELLVVGYGRLHFMNNKKNFVLISCRIIIKEASSITKFNKRTHLKQV